MSGNQTAENNSSLSSPLSSSLSSSFQRYVPKRELPDEIKQLPVDETVCKFCGVSYLVHHEVKRLDDLVNELKLKLEKTEKDNHTLSQSIKLNKDKLALVEYEQKQTRERLQSLLFQSLTLLQNNVIFWRSNIKYIKDHIPFLFKELPLHFKTLQERCRMSLIALETKKEHYRTSLVAMETEKEHYRTSLVAMETKNERERRDMELVNEQLKEELSCKSVELSEMVERESQLKNKICQLEKDITSLHESSHQTELELTDTIHQLQSYKCELNKEKVVSTEQIKNYEEQLRKEKSKYSILSKELEDAKKRLEDQKQKNISNREQLTKDKDTYNLQLLAKDKELVKLKLEIDKEHQVQEMIKTEHKTLLAKMKSDMERQRAKDINSLKLSHSNDLDHYKSTSQVKVEQLEKVLVDTQREYQNEIKELKSANYKMKLTFDAEISRHLSEEKDLRLEVEQCHKILSENENKLDESKKQIEIAENKMADIKRSSQEELEKRGAFYNQSLEVKSLEFNTKLAEMEKKLEAAYSEVQEMIKTEHKTLLAKMKSDMERQRAKEINSLKLSHSNDLDHYKSTSQVTELYNIINDIIG